MIKLHLDECLIFYTDILDWDTLLHLHSVIQTQNLRYIGIDNNKNIKGKTKRSNITPCAEEQEDEMSWTEKYWSNKMMKTLLKKLGYS